MAPKRPLKKPVLKAPKLAPVQGFPLLQYTSLLGTNSLLLLFSALYLPRSSLYFGDVLPSQQSSLDRPQHPFLTPLTASPPLTLGWACVGTAVIVMWWAGWIRVWWSADTKTKEKDTSKRVQGKLYSIRNAWLVTLVSTPIFYGLLILFGAPVDGHHASTGLLSLLLSLLVVYTPAYTVPLPSLTFFGYSSSADPENSTGDLLDKLTWMRLFSEFKITSAIERAVVYPAIGTLVGCWLGAFPLPLDWDRPWQAWPLIPAFGAIVGNLAGSFYGLGASTFAHLAEGAKIKED